MALTRLAEFDDGTILTESELEAEFDQIYGSSLTLISPLTASLDVNLKSLNNLVFERLGADPATPTAGRIYQLTTNEKLRIADGSNWANAGAGIVQSISFGGAADGLGNFLQANQISSAADVVSGNTTKHGVVAGTMQQMTMFHTGDLSSNNATMKIHVDGVVQKTLTASGAANTVDVFSSMAITVTDTDVIEVEFDAGTDNPSNSIITITVE